MENKEKIVVVGSIPEPVGGVSTFLSRLACHNMVSEIIDIYPSRKKDVPAKFDGITRFLRGRVHFIFYYFCRFLGWKNVRVHFNFSRPISLVMFFTMPKFGAQFLLTLHHGELASGRISRVLYRFALKKIDHIFCLSEDQLRFFTDCDVKSENITRTSSYVPPSFDTVLYSRDPEFDEYFADGDVFVASGYPLSIYNHDWCVKYVTENPGFKLAIFLYGEGDLDETRLVSGFGHRVRIFRNVDQYQFLNALARAKAYLRPTIKDSFGLAVADAIELGVPAVASDVCKRYPGTFIFRAGDYEDFKNTIDKVVNDIYVRSEKAEGFSAFSYDHA